VRGAEDGVVLSFTRQVNGGGPSQQRAVREIMRHAVAVLRGDDGPLGLPAPSERPWTRTGVEPCARRPFDLCTGSHNRRVKTEIPEKEEG